MSRIDKYYGTCTIIGGNKYNKLRELGYNGYHNQFRVVCKAKSRAEANRIAESYGLDKNTFIPNDTPETGNSVELEMADKYGFIICLGGAAGKEYIGIQELINE